MKRPNSTVAPLIQQIIDQGGNSTILSSSPLLSLLFSHLYHSHCVITLFLPAIVPSEITVGLLKRAVLEENGGMTQFLIDGFPRNLENNSCFLNIVGFPSTLSPSPSSFLPEFCFLLSQFDSKVEVKKVIFLECNEKTMIERILGRSLTSRRSDDNLETVRKRLVTFKNQTLPVVEFWESLGKLNRVCLSPPPPPLLSSTNMYLVSPST
jgi:adenylate kinase family enzyme